MKLTKAQRAKLEQASALAEEVKGELEETFAGKSERWQAGDAGTEMQEAIDKLDEIASELDQLG